MNNLGSRLRAMIAGRHFWGRTIGFVIVIGIAQLLISCGYSAPSVSNPSGTQVVNGTVSAVALTQVNNGAGGLTSATAVTLTVPLGTTSLVLCGDQSAKFSMNASVQVSYTNGAYCSTLISVNPM